MRSACIIPVSAVIDISYAHLVMCWRRVCCQILLETLLQDMRVSSTRSRFRRWLVDALDHSDRVCHACLRLLPGSGARLTDLTRARAALVLFVITFWAPAAALMTPVYVLWTLVQLTSSGLTRFPSAGSPLAKSKSMFLQNMWRRALDGWSRPSDGAPLSPRSAPAGLSGASTETRQPLPEFGDEMDSRDDKLQQDTAQQRLPLYTRYFSTERTTLQRSESYHASGNVDAINVTSGLAASSSSGRLDQAIALADRAHFPPGTLPHEKGQSVTHGVSPLSESTRSSLSNVPVSALIQFTSEQIAKAFASDPEEDAHHGQLRLEHVARGNASRLASLESDSAWMRSQMQQVADSLQIVAIRLNIRNRVGSTASGKVVP